MRAHNKLEIERVRAGSPAAKAGLRQGSVLLSINSVRWHDVIDFMFNKGCDELEIEFMRQATKGRCLFNGA